MPQVLRMAVLDVVIYFVYSLYSVIYTSGQHNSCVQHRTVRANVFDKTRPVVMVRLKLGYAKFI